jgi:hypothetical protein
MSAVAVSVSVSAVRPVLPFKEELYYASFWKHHYLTSSTNVRVWFLFKKIIDMIQSDYGYKDFDNIYPDELEISNEGYYNNHTYEVYVPNKKYDPSKPDCYNNEKQKGVRVSVQTEEELYDETKEYVKENIQYFSAPMIFYNIYNDKQVKEFIHYEAELNEIEVEEPEKVYDNCNCCVCLEDYVEEDDVATINYDNTRKTKQVASCGHTLCYGCWWRIIHSNNSTCPECREVWDEAVDDDESYDEEVLYTLEDIQILCEEEDNETLNDIINIPDLTTDAIRSDGYASILGYEEEEYYNWTDPPTQYRERGGCDDSVFVLVGEL